ncbi:MULTISPECIES: c-type cytochrome [Rhodanobacter]|jgi:ketosteroid isomerase-like protein/mono/diheme cytochrome c family protein|uniref:Cytochrome c family protein n=2 Tax=Rhodanobacter TaxID=75309 RepID=I4VSZ3_9GAMM|nr:c-type cytochrome [Rhodanobacter fulvus]EIL90334.1 cytochrome c family protein [Rhodanobacter fulvus Jip2]MCW0202056.1 c-type cytochrome [Rhodanobacter thiooxydans]
MKQHVKHYGIAVVALLAIVIAGGAVFVYSGIYNIGADDHHTKPVFSVMQTLRERSIHARSEHINVPNLEDPQLILKGAGQYAAMCTQCHLKPGMKDSELRPGLYPQPPNLSQVKVDPKDAFWVIKHGIKMSAMPAWGASHDDATIWSMVAFLQKLPSMTPAQYKDMVAKAPPDEDMDMGDEGGHSHSHGGSSDKDAHGAVDMQGMQMPDQPETGHSHDAAATDGHDHEHVKAAPAPEAPLSMEGMKVRAVPAAEAVAQAFHAALQRGDRAAVLALLAPDARISEGGHTQSRDEYASEHLDEDIAFLKAARMTPVSLGSMPMGDTAMVGSESTLQATSKGKPATLRSRELLNLKKDGGTWKIVSVQWQTLPMPER